MLQTQRWAAHRGLQDSAYNTYNTEARENKKEQVKFIAQYVSQHNRYILKLNIPSFHTVLISLWQKLSFVKRLVCKHADSSVMSSCYSQLYLLIYFTQITCDNFCPPLGLLPEHKQTCVLCRLGVTYCSGWEMCKLTQYVLNLGLLPLVFLRTIFSLWISK